MAGFTSYDDIINEITVNGKKYEWNFFKVPSAAEAAGVWHSLWTAVGTPGAGAAPATTPGTVYDDAAGSINFPDQASDQKHLLALAGMSSQHATLMLYDRLVAVSGISVASTGNKTVNSDALPRYTDGVDVQVWLEVTTATTTTAAVCSLNSYTANDSIGSGRSGGTITFPATATNQDVLVGPMPLQSGDRGVKSVEVGLNVGTAASAGVVNVVLLKPLAFLPLTQGISNERDLVLQITSMPRIYDGASLALAVCPGTSNNGNLWGRVVVGYG